MVAKKIDNFAASKFPAIAKKYKKLGIHFLPHAVQQIHKLCNKIAKKSKIYATNAQHFDMYS